MIAEVGLEPALIGAIAATDQTGQVSAPVKGYTGAVVFVVDNIEKSDSQTAEAEKVRIQATMENMAMQASVMALQRMADIEDLRGKYFKQITNITQKRSLPKRQTPFLLPYQSTTANGNRLGKYRQ